MENIALKRSVFIGFLEKTNITKEEIIIEIAYETVLQIEKKAKERCSY